MAFNLSKNQMILSGSCTIDTAKEFQDVLLAYAKPSKNPLSNPKGELQITGIDVESIDMATLQVLWSAKKTLKKMGQKLVFMDLSPHFYKALEESGLTNFQD